MITVGTKWRMKVIEGQCKVECNYTSQASDVYIFKNGKTFNYDPLNKKGNNLHAQTGDEMVFTAKFNIPDNLSISVLEEIIHKIDTGEIRI